MFKLVKILHAPTNAPEICYVPHNKQRDIKPGEAITLASGYLKSCTDAEKPTFITVAGCEKNSPEMVPCIHVCRDMVFEVELSEDAPTLIQGEELSLFIDSDGAAIAVTSNSMAGSAAVYEFSKDRTSKGDKIYVRFL